MHTSRECRRDTARRKERERDGTEHERTPTSSERQTRRQTNTQGRSAATSERQRTAVHDERRTSLDAQAVRTQRHRSAALAHALRVRQEQRKEKPAANVKNTCKHAYGQRTKGTPRTPCGQTARDEAAATNAYHRRPVANAKNATCTRTQGKHKDHERQQRAAPAAQRCHKRVHVDAASRRCTRRPRAP